MAPNIAQKGHLQYKGEQESKVPFTLLQQGAST